MSHHPSHQQYNIARLCGPSRSRCGYCKGDRSNVLSSPNPGDDVPPHHPDDDDAVNAQTSSKSYGTVFDKLSCADYESLINTGWRRSGRYVYCPDNWKSCCPQIPIRLNVEQFARSKSQKKVWRHLENVGAVRTTSTEDEDRKKAKREEEYFERFVLQSDFVEELQSVLTKVVGDFLKESSSSSVAAVLDDETVSKLCRWKYRKHHSSSKNLKQSSASESMDITDGRRCCIFSTICAAVAGRTKNTIQRTDLLRHITHRLSSSSSSSLPNGKGSFEICAIEPHEPSGQLSIVLLVNNYRPKPPPSSSSSSSTKVVTKDDEYIANILKSSSKNPPCLVVKSIPAEISSRDPKVHRLYCRYQHHVHGDDDPFESGDASQIQKGFKSFHRFLVDSPLFNPSSAVASDACMDVEGDDDDEENDTSIPHGSYHQHYLLNDHLIAVGVVDILPQGLSSVYSIYDPLFSKKYNLGKYTALREIEWVQKASRTRPQLKYYYMGYYIESCPKMKYKADYKPSELLCPSSFTWVDADAAVRTMMQKSPTRHCCAFVAEGRSSLEVDPRRLKSFVEGMLLDLGSRRDDEEEEEEEEEESGEDNGVSDNVVSVSMLNAYGRQIICPLMEEFVTHVGMELCRRCVVKIG